MRVRFQTSANSMTIDPVKDEDYGIVSCTATSVAGHASAAATLQVIGRYATHLSLSLSLFLSALLSHRSDSESGLVLRSCPSVCPSVCLFVCLSVAKMQKTRFYQKLSNLELWCLLTTHRKLCKLTVTGLFKEPITGSLQSKMAEIRHLENRHYVIFFCRGWSDLDKISQTGTE